MSEPDFKPLAFSEVGHDDVRPPMFDGDRTRGDDYVTGRLKSLHHAKGAILFIVGFEPGPDAKGDDPRCYGEVEYFVMRHKQRLIGKINRQAPAHFCSTLGERDRLQILDGLGTGPGIGGRAAAHFFCMVGGYPGQFAVAAYFKRGLLGGWNEVLIETPKKTLYAAYP